MAKTFTLDGKKHTLNPSVPRGQIDWLMGRIHVGTDDDEVRAEIARRGKDWPERVLTSAQHYALYCHRKNQKLYNFVARGG